MKTLIGVLTLSLFVVGVAQAALVAEWTFDGQDLTNSGTSGSVHDGTIVGTEAYSTDVPPGLTGYSLDLTAAEADRMRVNKSASGDTGYLNTFDNLSSFTCALWAKVPGAWTQWAPFAMKGIASPSEGWELRAREFGDDHDWNGLRVEFKGGGTALDPSPNVNVADKDWHMLTFTYDAATSNLLLYVDGLQIASTGSVTLTHAPTRALVFGSRETDNKGSKLLYDNIQIYDVALTSRQVEDLLPPQPPFPLQVDFGATGGFGNGTTEEGGTIWNAYEPGASNDDMNPGSTTYAYNLHNYAGVTSRVDLAFNWSNAGVVERLKCWDLHDADRDGDYLGVRASTNGAYNVITVSSLDAGKLYDLTVWTQASTDFRVNGGDVQVVNGTEQNAGVNGAASYTWYEVPAVDGKITLDWGHITTVRGPNAWASITAMSIKNSPPRGTVIAVQ